MIFRAKRVDWSDAVNCDFGANRVSATDTIDSADTVDTVATGEGGRSKSR